MRKRGYPTLNLSKDTLLAVLEGAIKPPTEEELSHLFKGSRNRLQALLAELAQEGLYRPQRPLFVEGDTIVGALLETNVGLRFIPSKRKLNQDFRVENAASLKADQRHGLFSASITSCEPPTVKVAAPLRGSEKISRLAAHLANLPMDFSRDVLKEAKKGSVPPLKNREDLRSIPLVTIDGKDSRDFDDAVWAEPDTNPKNKGGWHMIVAIADVAHYVSPGSLLDREAYDRGTSTYFPDLVLPMLPPALSNDLCSLRPDEDRACLAVHMWINKAGEKIRHRFCRGLMRSHARLTYEDVQTIHESPTHPRKKIVTPLYGSFKALLKSRKKRGTLEVELPEHHILFTKEGSVKKLVQKPLFESHKLIEEFMILANVSAAETLEEATLPCMYRIHDAPNPEKLNEVQHLLSRLQIPHKGPLKSAKDLTKLIHAVHNTPHQDIVNELVLRSQSQAVYSPKNIGHFGLNLTHYAHFTSPIRRYADLLVHRALLKTLGEKEGTLTREEGQLFEEKASHISTLERRAQGAERDAMDRYMTEYLSGLEGETFEVYVTGIAKAGLFVTIPNLNASGLVPLKLLLDDYYIYRENPTRLEGRRTRKTYGFGDVMKVRLLEADTTKGRLTFEPKDMGRKKISKFKKRQRRR